MIISSLRLAQGASIGEESRHMVPEQLKSEKQQAA
jgi:hypothetical protein